MNLKEVLVLIILFLVLLLLFHIIPMLGEMRHEIIPLTNPWAKTTPIDPTTPIFSIIAAAFILFRKRGS